MDQTGTPAPIAEVVKALVRCGAATDAAATDAILRALGWPSAIPAASIETKLNDAPRPLLRPATGEDARLRPTQRITVPSELRALDGPGSPEMADRPEIVPLRLAGPDESVPLFDKPIEPLFEPRLARAVLSRLCAVRMRRGELDVNTLVATIARGGVMLKLPRRPVSTLGPGVQLLIDVSPAMQPFREDTLQLYRGLMRTVGADRIDLRNFEACPLRGVNNDATQDRIAYVPPRAGTPVVAVTDLGLVRTGSRERAERAREWLELRRMLTSMSVALSVLTPYPETRLGHPRLMRQLRFVVWDRDTGVRQVPPAPLVRGLDE